MRLSRLTKLLLIGANVWFFGEGMLGPLFAVFTQRVGGDVLDITWAWAGYLIVSGLMYVLVGRVINKKPYVAQVMVAGYVLNAALTFTYMLVSTPLQLFFVQAALGVAEALGTPAWDALYARSINTEHDTFAWGLASGQSQIATGVAVVCGGLIVQYGSFNALFVTMGVVQLVAAGIQAQILVKTK